MTYRCYRRTSSRYCSVHAGIRAWSRTRYIDIRVFLLSSIVPRRRLIRLSIDRLVIGSGVHSCTRISSFFFFRFCFRNSRFSEFRCRSKGQRNRSGNKNIIAPAPRSWNTASSFSRTEGYQFLSFRCAINRASDVTRSLVVYYNYAWNHAVLSSKILHFNTYYIDLSGGEFNRTTSLFLAFYLISFLFLLFYALSFCFLYK